ncbi:MAG: coproporphyrinogen dehydrogenase HemZ [Firmicutes bacterium]|nr:coproporphyrinogen dehydrogenase HemZ [Bacillota bacterium]
MESIGIPFYFGEESFHIIAPPTLVPTIEAAIKSLVPNATFGSGRTLHVKYRWDADGLTVSLLFAGAEQWNYSDREILDSRYGEVDRERRLKERVRLGVQRVLETSYNLRPSPWGILTGVRPTKLVHSLFDRGFSPDQVERTLLEVYALSHEKVELLLDVVARQRPYFHSAPNNPISIYVGIPFCPTRCSYCSFAAYPLASHGHLLKGFLGALQTEINAVGSLIRELDLQVETVYLGGGTPTTVQGGDLAALLSQITSQLCTRETREFMVEAGRPETLTLETLQILKDGGVQRISINPQTMHDDTLQTIGREHSVQQVRTAFYRARQVGIPLINMDIILGLPGEQLEHVRHTLEEIGTLGPDNLTVHSLALKRASRLKKSLEKIHIAQEQGEAMVTLARDYALSWGMVPYYLYRQRHILGDLENIGYAKLGTDSIYNIQMMEERQTIIALGGGGITKLVSQDLSLVRQANPKCPATYSHQMANNLAEKLSRIREHFQG